MKWLAFLATLMVITILIFGIGAIWFLTHLPTPELLQLNQQIAEKRAEIELLQAKEAYNQSYVQAKRDLQRLQNQKDIEAGTLYRASVAISRSVLTLWPVWMIAAFLAVIWQQKSRWTPQTLFVYNGLRSMIPAKNAVALTREALKVEELRQSAEILTHEEELSHKRIAQNLQVVKTFKSLVPKRQPETSQPIEVEPEALPVFTGHIYYSQLLLDAEPGHIPYGRDMETGNIIQIPFKPLQSVVKLGKQGFGKSASTKLEILTAFDLKYVQKRPIRMHIIDSHYGLEDALTTEIEPVLPLFDTALLGSEVLKSDKILSFLQGQILDAETRQARKVRESDPWDLIFFDEYTSLVENHPRGKDIERLVKELLNLRKARKFLSICVYDSSKNDNSVRGMNPARLGISQLIFNTSEQQAAQLIGWSDYAKKAPGLSEGQCLIKLPKSKHVENEVSLCQCALVTDADLLKYIQYLPSEASKFSSGLTNGNETKNSQQEPPDESEDILTSDALKAMMEERKLSLSKLSKISGVPKSTLSNFFNGKGNLSDEQFTAIRMALEPKNTRVIPFEQMRKRLEKQE